jgi:hypothetical protein
MGIAQIVGQVKGPEFKPYSTKKNPKVVMMSLENPAYNTCQSLSCSLQIHWPDHCFLDNADSPGPLHMLCLCLECSSLFIHRALLEHHPHEKTIPGHFWLKHHILTKTLHLLLFSSRHLFLSDVIFCIIYLSLALDLWNLGSIRVETYVHHVYPSS